jgi:high-affinity iron transporter
MIRTFTRLLGAFLLLLILISPLRASETASSPAFVVHLLDYLAQDYRGAVSGGKVISASEYQEQVEFSRSALRDLREACPGPKNFN